MNETNLKPRERNGEPLKCDVLIIGSGLAGLLLAHELMDGGASVVLATKGLLADSNTSFAQGGMAAVTNANPLDTQASHLEDTIRSGAGLTIEDVARSIIESGGMLASRLAELGVNFDRDPAGVLDLALEGGHQLKRVLHSKDTTGHAISKALIDRVIEKIKASHSLVLEKTVATSLLQDSNEQVIGASLLVDARPTLVFAPYVVLATGGVGQIFSRTTNPQVATGDGIALAFRAGATLADLEFVQFHPTAFCMPGAPAFLISEAVRGAGAVLLDKYGDRFALKFHADGELATRDVVARAIYTTMLQQDVKSVFLDMRPVGKDLQSRFPKIVETLRSLGVDPLTQPVPVCPAAHYFMGGIDTTIDGETSLPGLYAIGECASTGLHGANRLASNSLLEAGVMALRLARHIANHINGRQNGRLNGRLNGSHVLPPIGKNDLLDAAASRPLIVPTDLNAFRAAMYKGAGLVRSKAGLEQLKRHLSENSFICTSPSNSLQGHANQLLVGKLIAEAALLRNESRGAHQREDFPQTDDIGYRKRLCVTRGVFAWHDLSHQGTTAGVNQALVTV